MVVLCGILWYFESSCVAGLSQAVITQYTVLYDDFMILCKKPYRLTVIHYDQYQFPSLKAQL